MLGLEMSTAAAYAAVRGRAARVLRKILLSLAAQAHSVGCGRRTVGTKVCSIKIVTTNELIK